MSLSLTTAVLQSFRRDDVPDWIEQCMATVRAWAYQSQFAYRWIGDDLLAMTPKWFRKKAGKYKTVVTDLGRLLFARQCLQEGFARVLWIDADVLIFNPGCLKLDPGLSYAYSREAWIWKDVKGRVNASLKVNNSACLFRNDSLGRADLDEYIAACLSIIQQSDSVRDHTLVGTKYLTSRNKQSRLPTLRGFGILSPTMMRAVLGPDSEILERFKELHDGPLYGANLCNFFRDASHRGIADAAYSDVVQVLLQTEGRLLNRNAEGAGA